MKNFVKKGLITLGTVFALLGVGGTVAFASGYITWNGTQDFQQTIANLNLISERGRKLKESNESINRDLEQTRNQLLDKDNKIDSLEQNIEALEKKINGGQTTQDQLKQAEKDMRDVKNKSQEVLNQFN